MTNQEAFDKAALHLLRQGCKSENVDTCLYRGPNGTKCAVGALIPDEEYDPSAEGDTIDSVVEWVPSLHGLDTEFLRQLQTVHDDSAVEEWPGELRAVAARFGLSDKVVRDFLLGDTGGV